MPFPAIIPLIVGLAGAAAQMSQANNQPGQKTPAPTAGGNSGMNPMTSFFGGMDGISPKPEFQPVQTPPQMPAAAPKAPPTTDLEGVDDTGGPSGRKTQQTSSDIGDLIASIPEALAVAGPMLGLGGEEGRKQIAPPAGSVGMNQGATFNNLPRPPSLGELLAALPRMR